MNSIFAFDFWHILKKTKMESIAARDVNAT